MAHQIIAIRTAINGKSKYIIHERVKFRCKRISKKGLITWCCSRNSCKCKVITDAEGAIVNVKGQHANVSHELWDDNRVKRDDLTHEVCDLVSRLHLKPRSAYKQTIRENPSAAVLLRGFKDVANKAYAVRKKRGWVLPRSRFEIPGLLKRLCLDKNLYGQLLLYKGEEASEKQKKEWQNLVDDMYLGDGGMGRFAIFGHREGSRILKKCKHVLVDQSFQCAFRISPFATDPINPHIPFPGVTHILGVDPPKFPDETPMAVHCGQIHFREIKPDEDTYYDGFMEFRKQCIDKFDIDVIDPQHEPIGMSDMEQPLRNAVRRCWTNMKQSKICHFHVTQAVDNKIGELGLKKIYSVKGKDFVIDSRDYLKCYHSLPLASDNLIPRCFNLLSRLYPQFVDESYWENIRSFQEYFRRQYMKNMDWIREWCHFEGKLRSNNILEGRNGIINERFGNHPYLFDFVLKTAQIFAEGAIGYKQYEIYSHTNKKDRKEILKEKCLDALWVFHKKYQKDEHLLYFLDMSAVAMSAKPEILERLLVEIPI